MYSSLPMGTPKYGLPMEVIFTPVPANSEVARLREESFVISQVFAGLER